ncbi:DUF397 domain-containing protein [Kitasatospora aureofaciens]|uniref:DUF397 domain-containing protein n=1 Tax=Kitasatospora aureofaciens TaxID=1894 RepID=UPI001C46E20F|nr:DUF397 domain-containing protein [Kitasatospora aureofaciens]MBV6700291.1 DUF397 domain-containing protein [Kitasatospora aureofaciens]
MPRSAPADWTSSTHSGNSGQCVQWRTPPGETLGRFVEIRDSKDPSGPTLTFPVESWAAFAEFASAHEV